MNALQNAMISLFLGLLLVSSTAIAAPEYTLSASPAIDIPDQTTTYQGTEYTVGSITRVFPGESASVSTTVPSNETYDLNLRGPDNQIISSDSKTGDSSHTLDYFGAGEAGTYVVTLRDNNEIQAVRPVVLAGYGITVESPDSVTNGDSATVTATISERSVEKHSSLDYVELVVGTETVQIQKRMEKQSDGKYTATVSTTDLETETYNMYVTVRGDAEVRQRPEFLAVSDQSEIEITSQSTDTTDSSGSDAPSGGGSSSPAETQTATPNPTTTQTTATPTATMTEVTSTTPERTSTAEKTEMSTRTFEPPTETQTDHTGQSPTASPHPSDILDPATDHTETVTAGSGPGFTAGLAFLAVILSIALGVSRN